MSVSPASPVLARPVPPRQPSRRLVVCLAFAVVIAGALAVLAVHRFHAPQPRLSGTNGLSPSETVVSLEAGETACQLGTVPAHTGAIELPIGVGSPSPA